MTFVAFSILGVHVLHIIDTVCAPKKQGISRASIVNLGLKSLAIQTKHFLKKTSGYERLFLILILKTI